jgi:hypothetical protein
MGLAPFVLPSRRSLGKDWRWVAGGAIGMQPLDWFDLFLHGTPVAAVAPACYHSDYSVKSKRNEYDIFFSFSDSFFRSVPPLRW